jgi:hypothetical protein
VDLGLSPRSYHLFDVLSWNIIEGEGESRPNRSLYLGFANKKYYAQNGIYLQSNKHDAWDSAISFFVACCACPKSNALVTRGQKGRPSDGEDVLFLDSTISSIVLLKLFLKKKH